mgnify:CR=1 FL=1
MTDRAFADWREGNPPKLGELYTDDALFDREACIELLELTPETISV